MSEEFLEYTKNGKATLTNGLTGQKHFWRLIVYGSVNECRLIVTIQVEKQKVLLVMLCCLLVCHIEVPTSVHRDD